MTCTIKQSRYALTFRGSPASVNSFFLIGRIAREKR